MPLPRALLALACLSPLAGLAQDIDLSDRIASGKWTLNYERTAEFKPLKLKNRESGASQTCIAGNARDKIVDWISSKGCRIDKEAWSGGVYRLEGECRLKWWKQHPIPVRVELRPETPTRFKIDIATRDDSVLGYQEHTLAVHQGPCDPALNSPAEPAPGRPALKPAADSPRHGANAPAGLRGAARADSRPRPG
ncbi:MAG: hypothetical protein ACOZB0_06890 [Pseudomonadota bacterium]